MNARLIGALMVVVFTIAVAAHAGDRKKVIELVGFEGEKEYQALGEPELKQLKEDIKFESRFIDKAYKAAMDEWKARKQPGGFAFSKPQPRKLTDLGSFGEDEATKKVDSLTDLESKRQDSKAEREERKMKAAGNNEKKTKASEDKKAAMAAAKDIFVDKLEELVNAAKTGAPAPGAAAVPAVGAKDAK